jgi:hypothetical protein
MKDSNEHGEDLRRSLKVQRKIVLHQSVKESWEKEPRLFGDRLIVNVHQCLESHSNLLFGTVLDCIVQERRCRVRVL